MPSREGLYIMVFCSMMASCQTCSSVDGVEGRLESKLNNVNGRLDSLSKQYQFQERNVLGNPKISEKFYEINGQRFYLEIDGKPVEEYFRNSK